VKTGYRAPGRSTCGLRFVPGRASGILFRESLRSRLASETGSMSLTLSMLRCPDHVAPETRTIAGGEFSIGRGPDNDWVLPDPERGLSKRHCVLAFRSGGWQLADLSTNGTFVNRESEPIGRGAMRELRDGDRLSFGAYEIEVHIDPLALPRAGGFAPPRAAAPPEMFALDPFAAPAARDLPASGSADDPFAAPLTSEPVRLPPDFDPLLPDRGEHEFRGPTQPDHNPHIEDAFVPQRQHAVLPDDWDRDAGAVFAAPPAAPTVKPELPAPSPAPVIVAPAPPPAPTPQPAGEDLLAAFLRGAGLDDRRPHDPVAAMEALGAAFRAVVAGLREAMVARASVKGEFRIEQTMIRSRGNNPLKFAADDEDALSALLSLGRRTEMGPAEAVADALRDMRRHELATVAAMQAAIRALLAEFDPGKLREAAAQAGLALLPAQRKAHAWDAFEAQHARITQALTDDFDSVFGKAFARAYERALAELTAREGAP
jgi:type VI secretion system protein ImpI/type VI secretion system protein